MFLVQLSSDGVQLTQELSVFRAGALGGCALWAKKQKINQIPVVWRAQYFSTLQIIQLIQVNTEILKFVTFCSKQSIYDLNRI